MAAQRAITASHYRRQAFARAAEGPPDAELVARAVAEGRVTKVAPGSALVPGWISGDTGDCVKPRATGRGGSR